jgi:hypothetical protein
LFITGRKFAFLTTLTATDVIFVLKIIFLFISMIKHIVTFFLSVFICHSFARAQEALPAFSVINKGNNRILISWVNGYGPAIKQLSIQRSADSLKNYKSIITLPDATVPQNGFLDTKAASDQSFYRLFILLDSGKYLFSKPSRPLPDTATTKPGAVVYNPSSIEKNNNPAKEITIVPEKIIYVFRRDSLVAELAGDKTLKRFKDSISTKTKDTLQFKTADTLLVKPFIPKEVFRPSKYVFTDTDGNIRISLLEAHEKKYSIKFYEENNDFLFEVKSIKENIITLEKSNFIHAGWFRFELFDNGVLKEKHKFFVQKDF